MLRRIKRNLIILAVALAPASTLAVPVAVSAQCTPGSPNIQDCVGQGTCLSTETADCPTEDPGTNANDLIADVINIFSLVVGVIAVIMIIVGGFRYITSAGNDSKVSGAKNTIMYAIIGLVIVALAQFIVRFVLDKVTA